MAKRKKITLAPTSADRPSRAMATATHALARFGGAGYRSPEGPTPERLLKAAGAARIDRFNETVEISRGDVFEAVSVEHVRIKVEDSPLDRLKNRKLLAPKDGQLNMILARAGATYRGHWIKAGLEPLSGMDPTKEACGGSGNFGLFQSEASAHAFSVYCAARGAVPKHFRAIVDAIVLYDREPVDVGRQYGIYGGEKQAQAIAVHDLQRGLKCLAIHFHLLQAHEDIEAEGVEA